MRLPAGAPRTRALSDKSTVVRDLDTFQALSPEWNTLAELGVSPFLTYEWLRSWWVAFGQGELFCLVLHDEEGSLRAGAFCGLRPGRKLVSTANPETGDWDVVAADEPARARMWDEVARHGGPRIELSRLPEHSPGAEIASARLARAGYRTVSDRGPYSPFRRLPSSSDELRASLSRNLRSQVGRRRRALGKQGALQLRVCTGGPTLEDDVEALLRVEASGWKTRSGTAILSDPRTARLYREFAYLAASRGWLRLYLLELDGALVAGDYGCSYAGRGFLLKTGFDERHSALSPGLVLREAVLSACVEEGLSSYDFLGGPEPYKLRWTEEIRPRVTLRAYRGPVGLPAYAYWSTARPLLRAGRDRLLKARERFPGWRGG